MVAVNSLFGMMDMGRGGLLASQKGIDVAGHNIANVNTPGYSRQRMVLATRMPLSAHPGQVGTGVAVSEIIRIYDRYLEAHLRQESADLGRWEAEKGAMERLEMLVQGSNLDEAMGQFWNAWEDLSNNPSGQAERVVLVARSEHLASRFQSLYSAVKSMQTQDMGTTVAGTVSQINLIASQIADLNQTILRAEADGQNANDSRDKRDSLVRDLSSLIEVNVVEGSDDGMFNIFVGNGRALVQGNQAVALDTEENPETHLTDIMYVTKGGDRADITAEIDGGKLKGLRPDGVFQEFLDRLDDLARAIITKVNELHKNGYGLTDEVGEEGRNFFSGDSDSASNMAVNDEIKKDVNLIAAASRDWPAGGNWLPGDNRNALAIAGLRNALVMQDGKATIDMAYNSLVSWVGTCGLNAASYCDQQAAMFNQAETLRDSISGVQLDEEMVDLLQFQHSYAAAAQYIRMIDNLLEEVIKLV